MPMKVNFCEIPTGAKITNRVENKMTIELAGILITVVLQALYIAYKIGKFEQKLEILDKKQDKHNNLVERMVRVEDSTKSAHKRIDDMKA